MTRSRIEGSTTTSTSGSISDLPESVQDIVGAMVVAGANVSVTYDDTAGTLTIAATGVVQSSTLTEQVQDIVGAFASGSGGVSVTYDDSANTLVVSIADGALSIAKTSGLQTALDAKEPVAERTLNAQAVDYTLVLADAPKTVVFTSATAVALTVPPNSSVAFPTGTRIRVRNSGAGGVTVALGAGVTVDGTTAVPQYHEIVLAKVGTDSWRALGAEPVSTRVLNTQTGDYTLVLSDAAKVVVANKASAIAFTVPTNASVAFALGTRIQLRNIGAGVLTVAAAGGVTLNGVATVQQWNQVDVVKTGTDTWQLLRTGIAGGNAAPPVDIQTFTANGTWTMPTAPPGAAPYSVVRVLCIGGGSGGGGGARYAASAGGGGGGAGGARCTLQVPAAAVSATATVAVAAGGAGGASQTVDSTNGNPGNIGGASSFTATGFTVTTGSATAPGGGGSGAGGAGGAAVSREFTGATGGTGSTGAATGSNGTAGAGSASGGGGGGGISSGGTPQAGGAGGAGSMHNVSGVAGGAATGANGSNGPNTTSPSTVWSVGGGGGGASAAGPGGAGGTGGAWGGGGGGGAGSINGQASGAGGTGGAGFVQVITQ